ncbi:uncharacterized protein LOC142326242 [Lycorma delicatula]|uniref:uncharacterized protein LOC142326242 n=1 Tax=Lycorma delicatula TaxID=130591 RepID=UPI003F50E728
MGKYLTYFALALIFTFIATTKAQEEPWMTDDHMESYFGESIIDWVKDTLGISNAKSETKTENKIFTKSRTDDSSEGSKEEMIGSNEWLKKNVDAKIPHFPKNFPFPPQMTEIPDIPGLKFPDCKAFISGIKGKAEEKHKTFLCSDPRYKEKFYMLKTTCSFKSEHVNVSNSSTASYYTLDHHEMKYEPEIKYDPLF